jgi:hypothetical protein
MADNNELEIDLDEMLKFLEERPRRLEEKKRDNQ